MRRTHTASFIMTDRLQVELAEAMTELQRLHEGVSVGTPPVYKDLSLISLITKWSGAETGIPLVNSYP